MKTLFEAIAESSCQKRVTVCAIYDKEMKLLSIESNRCDPSGGTCHRLGLVQDKASYDINSHCNWTHAEIMAIKSLPKGAQPYMSVLYGHSFYCNACEAALKEAGVTQLEINNIDIQDFKTK